MKRREFVTTAAIAGTSLVSAPRFALAAPSREFPSGFLWGAATSAYQTEGNNIASDVWAAEAAPGSPYAERSGDAANSFALWPVDLDLVKAMGLNSYRFSLEWGRIEPRMGEISIAMLDHYKRMIEGCHARGLAPIVTFNHFTTPLWFALEGGWENLDAPDRFARFCDTAARHLAGGMAYATTLNEPNLVGKLPDVLPSAVAKWLVPADKAAGEAVAKAHDSEVFLAGNSIWFPDVAKAQANLLKGHAMGRQAIKAVRPELPVGVSLAIVDDEAVGRDSLRDSVRQRLYADWLAAARDDDFVGVQNYERALWDRNGRVPAPPGGDRNMSGEPVYPPSLAHAVRYAHSVAKVPVIVTEHGVNTPDDAIRQRLIPAALAALRDVMADGVPVKGYMHWSLVDNFEWGFGYKPQYGLHLLDRKTFVRTPKPSAGVLGAIARANRV